MIRHIQILEKPKVPVRMEIDNYINLAIWYQDEDADKNLNIDGIKKILVALKQEKHFLKTVKFYFSNNYFVGTYEIGLVYKSLEPKKDWNIRKRFYEKELIKWNNWYNIEENRINYDKAKLREKQNAKI